MKRQLRSFIGTTLIGLMGVTGCAPTQPFFAHEDGDLSHYLNQVQEPDYPDVEAAGLEEAHMAESPKTISNPDFSDTWDLTLEEAISMALHNSKVIRSSGQITQFDIADGLLSRTAAATTVYDPAVTGTNVNNSFFSRSFSPDRNSGVAVLSHDLSPENVETANSVASVESELAEFDALFSARAEWRTGDRAQNSSPIFSQSKNGNFAFGLSKKTATGGAVMIGHGVTYTRSNAILRTLPSDHVAVASLEFRHPLMRGRGTQFNRIPIVLARINEDISTAEFQVAIRNLCLDVENAYWDLQCAYRGVETATTGRDASQRTWSRTYELYKGGGDTNRQAESQSREQYYFFRSQLETALADVYEAEAKLRYLMGLAPTDKRMIRPSDDPSIASLAFDWTKIRAEALFRRAELRQQKWRIKQRELELIQARNQLLPSVNFSARYNWVGTGDELITSDRRGLNFPTGGSTAYDELTEGNFQESFLGLEFLPPAFGARKELLRIRNANLSLARDEARLEDMELQAVHLLSTSLRNKDRNFRLAQTHLNRWAATENEVNTTQAAWDEGKSTLNNRPTFDILLDAQRRRAQAQFDYYRALCDYNKAIAKVHFHKGSLLHFSGVHLSEGPWPDKAYWDAIEKARQRDASYYLDYGWTRPSVVSRGAVDGGEGVIAVEEIDGEGVEAIVTPEPTPATGRDPGDPAGDNNPAPMDPPMKSDEPAKDAGPKRVTSRPDGPALLAPERRAAANPTVHAKTASFEWGGLGIVPPPANRQPATSAQVPQPTRPASQRSDPADDDNANPLRSSQPIGSGLR